MTQSGHGRTSGVTTPDQEDTARPRLADLTLPHPETHRSLVSTSSWCEIQHSLAMLEVCRN
jgi:hypothetical protein